MIFFSPELMERRISLAKIHVAKKALGLDDDTYRAILAKLTGKSSAKYLSFHEQQIVLNEMRRYGLKEPSKSQQSEFKGGSLPKIRALWIAGWNSAIVHQRSDKRSCALLKNRPVSIISVFYMSHAMPIVEGLKAWLERRAGVSWPQADPVEAVMRAQFNKLCAIGEEQAYAFVGAVDKIIGKSVISLSKEERQALMNAFGARIRKAKKDGRL